MENIIEIKASNKQTAITRALKILEVNEDQIVDVKEIKKSSSFFGFFKKDGIYQIEIKNQKDISIINNNPEKKEESVTKTKETQTPIINDNIHKIDIQKKISISAQELLNKMGLNLDVEIQSFEGKYCVINLSGEDNGIIIGKKGKTLNSYEYLLNTLFKEYKIEVDVEGFKEKRNITLRELAKKMSEKVIKTGKPIKLNPMPPRERKIIHEIINKYSELDTYSEGKDPKRYIVIKKRK